MAVLSRMLRHVVWYKFADVSVVIAAFIIAASIFATTANFRQCIRRNIPPLEPEISLDILVLS
jgi:hypothetical protein